VNAAVVSPAFLDLLLKNPAEALATGYNDEVFKLTSEEREWVIAIRATSLTDFALQLSNGQSDGGGHK
jgi:hypothetical protein